MESPQVPRITTVVSQHSMQALSGDDMSLFELNEYLNTILVDVLVPGSVIKPDKRPEVVTLLHELCRIMMGEFPKPGVTEWSMLQERIQIIEVSLEILHRALLQVDGILGETERLEKVILIQFLIFGGTLELWISSGADGGEGTGPRKLKTRLRSVALDILRILAGAGSKPLSGKLTPCGDEFRKFLEECLGIATELFQTTFTGPKRFTFFRNPRLSEDAPEIEDDTDGMILIQSSAVFDSLIIDSLFLVAHTTLHANVQAIMPRLTRLTTGVICSYVSGILDLSSNISLSRRTSLLARMLEVILPLLSLHVFEPHIIIPVVCQLLVRRLHDGPQAAWVEVDEHLINALEAVPIGTRLARDHAWFQELLESRNWDNENEQPLREMIYICLRILTPLVEVKRLRVLETSLRTQYVGHRRNLVLETITEHISQQPEDPQASYLGKRKRDAGSLRSISLSSITGWLFPDNPTWMGEDEDLSDSQWCFRMIDSVTKGLHGSLDHSPKTRVFLAERLARVPCLLSHPGISLCSRQNMTSGVSFIPPFLAIVIRVLDGSEDKVSVDTRRHAYEFLSQAIKHHSQGFGGNKSEVLANLTKQGMLRRERSVRLCAGRALAELALLYHRIGRGSTQRLDLLFRSISELLNSDQLAIIETTLISIGLIGRVAQGELLGKILLLVIPQLGHRNPIIKGVAYMQLLDLTRYQSKSPYALLSPYLPQISVQIISQLHMKPEVLLQTCVFLNMTASKFYNLTVTHFLPHLVCACNGDVLNQVARELRKSPVSLVTTHDVLAHIFLLEGSEATEKVFDFILELLRRTKNDNSEDITVAMLVKSTVVPLLGEIVICMGDGDPKFVEQAISAVQKVEQVLSQDRRHRTSTLLVDYIMGVVSHLNEVLQDVHGKRTLTVKKKVMRSLGVLVHQVGSQITTVAPQIMATMQSMLVVPGLTDETLFSWHTFITTLAFKDIGPYVGPTSAVFVSAWPKLSTESRNLATKALKYLLIDNADAVGDNLNEMVRLNGIPELASYSLRLDALRSSWSPLRQLQNLLDRITSDNMTVAELSLLELKQFMHSNQQHVLKLASGDIFDPIISKIMTVLWATARRDGEGAEILRSLAFDCLGRLGAVDPDRLELHTNDMSMILYQNFEDEEESIRFALYLITDVLLGTFRSTSDIKFQSHLAFAIQELLKFCGFTEALVSTHPSNAVSLKTRSRWSSLPRHVLEACTPLLQAKYAPRARPSPDVVHPIYPSRSTYREWMQDWTAHLIDRVRLRNAKAIFNVFRPVVVDRDVGVARHLLPHLVLHILISGDEIDANNLKSEIVAVLQDQIRPVAGSPSDRKLLSAQTIFMLMDHLNKWIRAVRQEIVSRRTENRRVRGSSSLTESEDHLVRVDSVLSSVDHDLMAKAAFECKAYARSLMNFERQILTLKNRGVPPDDMELQTYYERLHEIYAHLDEPDGMEGITTKVLEPSLEHQIRQHESTGRWTSAQSCWEVRLQNSPDNVEYHLGLLRCLRNLGHYDTLRTHIKGILSRNSDWNHALSGFQIEGAWMVGDWHSVQELARNTTEGPPPEIIVARVLLAIRQGNDDKVSNALSIARAQLGAPIHAAGLDSYRRAYDSVLNLHLVRDVELIYETIVAQRAMAESKDHRNVVSSLSDTLSRRFEATLPSFRTREPILSLQRTALGLSPHEVDGLKSVIGRAWLSTAKISRKAGHIQTAYSAVLQARRLEAPFSFIQSAKLVKMSGEPLRALQELSKALDKTITTSPVDVIDLTGDGDPETTKMKAKAQVLLAQWMYDAERFDVDVIHKGFKDASSVAGNWESAHFHLGNFYDQRYARMSAAEKITHGPDMNYQTIKCYIKTLQTGSKYVYQTMPRLLTLWLDLGEKENASIRPAVDVTQILTRVNSKILSGIRSIATYKWLTAFPQIVSRVDHSNKAVYEILSRLIMRVLEEYPHQGLWLFMSVVQSKKKERSRRGTQILSAIMNNPANVDKLVSSLASQCRTMTSQLLTLCNHKVGEETKSLSMMKHFPGLAGLAPSPLIVPLQESLVASLPSESSLEASHQPFTHHLPTIQRFGDSIDVMKSLAKPRKISILADNGKTFAFLGKPKDDLRKDARLMDFNAIINKLLKTNSDSRRRQLHIRTYSVVTLNEESGFIQWVPNTVPVRPVLARIYDVKGIQYWSAAMVTAFQKIKDLRVDKAVEYFVTHVLPMFPPVFHEWFIDTFPEPSAWLASRLSYARTAAVMSMVGFILGLGDRHSENILLDVNTGDVIHVDFDCLFEKGKKLETPERVPFRLTQNIQDGLGVTNVDGPFRIACEVTMGLLRRNKDCLMSVLDAFIHDPLVEWEDEKKKAEKQRTNAVRIRRGQVNDTNTLRDETDLRDLAKHALYPIQRKLQGIYISGDGKEDWTTGKEMTTSNLVDALIQDARSNKNLARMYMGWAPHL